MGRAVRLSVAGVGNNVSALLQGVYFYADLVQNGHDEYKLPGIKNPRIGDIAVSAVKFVGAFDVDPGKIGKDLRDAIVTPPNNYPRLAADVPVQDVLVEPGIENDGGESMVTAVTKSLIESGTEVLLYSLPTGRQHLAELYARAALDAGVAFVNCTPENIARDPALLSDFQEAGLPLVGDDLASHLGTSVVHRALLQLLGERGITMTSSYQLNVGGNEDFRNLLVSGSSKRTSKLNALAQAGIETSNIVMVPSAAFIPHLGDRKVAMVNIEGVGWGQQTVSLDVLLKVQDSSNAAGVIIDLVRIAAVSLREGTAGFPRAAIAMLKSPPIGTNGRA
jgi:myo-inositol-1-phosphate synthase